MPLVSIIVPVRNEAGSIQTTLGSLLNQDYPNTDYEVIVADGGSTDATVPIVRELQSTHTNLKLVYNAGRWSSAGRNVALRQMAGQYAVIIDGHCHVPDSDYVANLATAFTSSNADCLGRPQPLDVPAPSPFQRAVSLARSCRLGHNPSSDIFSTEAKFVPPQSTAVAYRREVFTRLGLFDERFDACEDVEFNERVAQAGMSCYFTPSLKIIYDPRASYTGLFHQLGRYGAGRARLAAKHPKSLSLPAIVPPVWLVWLAVGPLLSLTIPYFGILWLASVGFYFAVMFGAAAVLGAKSSVRVAVQIAPILMTIHFGFAVGFWREVVRRTRRKFMMRG